MAREPFRALAIIEQPYRGSTERGYADCFYLARVLNAQLGNLAVLLRGEGVLAAIGDVSAVGPPPAAPTAALQDLIADGMDVHLAGEDLERLGLGRADLLPGVRVAVGPPARTWHQYQAVWFL